MSDGYTDMIKSGNYEYVPPKIRGFDVVKGCWTNGKPDVELPIQMTENAAGYDFECAEDVTIYPVWGAVFRNIASFMGLKHDDLTEEEGNKLIKPTLVPTGIKAYMGNDEALYLYNRSSNPLKKFLILANGAGIIDADYYENEDNDGHIMFQYINFGVLPIKFKRGERIGQGIFAPVLRADKGKHRKESEKRKGGHGSTN